LRAIPRRSSILTARGGTILLDLFIQSSILATAISEFDLPRVIKTGARI
jgi:hypothetical protein